MTHLTSGIDKMSTLMEDLRSTLEYIANDLVVISCHPLRKRHGNLWTIRGPNKNFVVMILYQTDSELCDEVYATDDVHSIQENVDDNSVTDFQNTHDADVTYQPVTDSAAQSATFKENSREGTDALSDICNTDVENVIDDLIDSRDYEIKVKCVYGLPESIPDHNLCPSDCEDTSSKTDIHRTNEVKETDASPSLEDCKAYLNSYCEITIHEDASDSKASNLKIVETKSIERKVNEDEIMGYQSDQTDSDCIDILNVDTIIQKENARSYESVQCDTKSHRVDSSFNHNLMHHCKKHCNKHLPDNEVNRTVIFHDNSLRMKRKNMRFNYEVPIVDAAVSTEQQLLHKNSVIERAASNKTKVSSNWRQQDSEFMISADDDVSSKKEIAKLQYCTVLLEPLDMNCMNNNYKDVTQEQLTCQAIKQEPKDEENVNVQSVQCGKSLKMVDNDTSYKYPLNKHDHIVVKQYHCSMCDKNFSQKIHLHQHMLVHDGEKQYQCSQCGKEFLRKYSLHRHKLIHAGVKPYNCTLCDKNFSQKTHLQQHMKVHTGLNRNQCLQASTEQTSPYWSKRSSFP